MASEYLLRYDNNAGARLDLQHYFTQARCGFLLHPDIPIPNNARIVDIATGTGIWPISISKHLPPSVQIDGYDISDAQFPPKEWWPANVNLDVVNILSPIPEQLKGKYDIVSVRYVATLVKQNNPFIILNNLCSLLKPGGYLQWIEFNNIGPTPVASRPDLSTSATESFVELGRKTLLSKDISFEWLLRLPESFQEVGMMDVKNIQADVIPGLRSIGSFVLLAGWEEISHSLPTESSREHFQDQIQQSRKEILAGVALDQELYVTIGRRPLKTENGV